MALPQPPLKDKLKPTIVFVLPLVLLVALAAYIRYAANNEPLYFQVDAPGTLIVNPDVPVTMVDLTLRLRNRTGDAVDLVVSSQCHILRWYLLDAAGGFVQSDPMEGCQEGAVADRVGGQNTLVRTTAIPLDTRRLRDGDRYELRLQFWGHETRHRFRVRYETQGDDES